MWRHLAKHKAYNIDIAGLYRSLQTWQYRSGVHTLRGSWDVAVFLTFIQVLSICSVFLAIGLEKGRKIAVSHEPRNV